MTTDKRITFLLKGGELFLAAIDPQGIAARAKTAKLSFTKGEEGSVTTWWTRLTFPDSDTLIVTGTAGPDGILINGLKMPAGDGFQEIPAEASKTLAEAFGPLDGIPARLKRNLSPTAKETAAESKSGPFAPDTYFDVALDALCWGAEGGNDEKTRSRFRKVKASFIRDTTGEIESVDLEAVCLLGRGAVKVDGNLNVFGLSNKRALAVKELGNGRKAEAVCTVKKDDKTFPSITAAFALYNAIPSDRSLQRKMQKKKGLPKAKG